MRLLGQLRSLPFLVGQHHQEGMSISLSRRKERKPKKEKQKQKAYRVPVRVPVWPYVNWVASVSQYVPRTTVRISSSLLLRTLTLVVKRERPLQLGAREH